jgi:hypothetical protein
VTLTSEEARRTLDDHKEAWLSLGSRHGGVFAEKAVGELLRGVPWAEAHWWLLRSAMARGDKEACRMFVNDWSGRTTARPPRAVWKFVPGDHYYALDQKFDSLTEARRHLERHGFSYGGLQEKHAYKAE